MKKGLKLRADYECHPLWWWKTDIGNVDPSDLHLPTDLVEELREWAAWYDSTLNQEYPPDSGFESEADQHAFEAQGRRLWKRLKQVLGPEYDVFYHSDLHGLLDPDENNVPTE